MHFDEYCKKIRFNKCCRAVFKYVDIIEYPSAENIGEQLNMCISLGDENYLDPYLHLRSEKHEGDVVIIVQLAGNARAEGPEIKTREGFMIDIDCIINKRNLTLGMLYNILKASLTHYIIKIKLFSLTSLLIKP